MIHFVLLIPAAFLYAFQFLFNQRFRQLRREGIDASLAFPVCASTATTFPMSVQYPVITGGVMVFPTRISICCREAITMKTYVAAGLALLSTFLMIF